MIDLVAGGFGLLAFVAYGATLLRRYRKWRRTRTAAALRELLAAAALFIVACAGIVAIFLARPDVSIDVRRFIGFLAWGAFGAAGVFVYDATSEDDE